MKKFKLSDEAVFFMIIGGAFAILILIKIFIVK